jgi:hypothetical protein
MLISKIQGKIPTVRCGVCRRNRLTRLAEPSFFSSIKVFGVAFQEVQPRWHHAAIIFSDGDDGSLRVLHLGGHFDFRNDAYSVEFKTIPCPDFDEDELDLLAEQARRMWKKNGQGLPYNFDYDGSAAFDFDMSFLSEKGRGLTCATFVLAFFDRYGHKIVDASSWKFRPEDTRWQQTIHGILRSQLAPEHAARMIENIGGAARFRPEEVVASVNRYVGEPITFTDGIQYGVDFMSEFHAAAVKPCSPVSL